MFLKKNIISSSKIIRITSKILKMLLEERAHKYSETGFKPPDRNLNIKWKASSFLDKLSCQRFKAIYLVDIYSIVYLQLYGVA